MRLDARRNKVKKSQDAPTPPEDLVVTFLRFSTEKQEQGRINVRREVEGKGKEGEPNIYSVKLYLISPVCLFSIDVCAYMFTNGFYEV